MTPHALHDWSLVVPVKVLAQAKSRLTGLPAPDRAELALAMAADTVAAAMTAALVGVVLVITDDAAVGAEMARLGARVLPDEPAAGLNEALAFGAAYAKGQWPERGVAGLAGDLPALRPDELTTALRAAARHGLAIVPDADGTGTTLYAAGPGVSFEPHFGVGSAARHRAAGAAELDLPGQAGLRRDVDTAEDLRLATAIGLGPRTTAVLAAARRRRPNDT
jgi:2-phospho-L-lactate/phosphoenolpyruvate guanylyltransferase